MLIPFDFACNDDYGMYSGRVAAVHLPGGCLDLDTLDMCGPVFKPIAHAGRGRAKGMVRISRRLWGCRHLASHVGNIYWERFAIDEAERFVFWMRGSKLFTLDGGWSEMADWFDKPTTSLFDGYDKNFERAWVRGKLLEAIES